MLGVCNCVSDKAHLKAHLRAANVFQERDSINCQIAPEMTIVNYVPVMCALEKWLHKTTLCTQVRFKDRVQDDH